MRKDGPACRRRSLCGPTFLLIVSVCAGTSAEGLPPLPAQVMSASPLPPLPAELSPVIPLPPLPGSAAPQPTTSFDVGTTIPQPWLFGNGDEPLDGIRPRVLRRPIGPRTAPEPVPTPITFPTRWRTPVDPPIGYTGKSSVMPVETQQDPHFVPVEDRWRTGYSAWDRYDKGHPRNDDYPFLPGRRFDPFNQNVIKGDFPIIGQHTFLDVTASYLSFQEFRQVPTATTPFESTARPNEQNFFQRPNQFFSTNFFSIAFDLTHGDAAFKPADWRLRLVPTFNFNNLSVQELGVVSPNVLQGTSRTRNFWALQEAFFETKITDTSSDYDFTSIRVGTQPFISDFRGFLFADINRAVRIFGTRNANRDQYNLAYFRQWEKDTNSQLNTFNDRRQNLFFFNYYRQDFLVPGYTAQVSVTYNNDPRSFKFDNNRFLVRPDPVGIARPHEIDVAYLGWAGDGHIGRYNLTHQFYWALGRDSLNPLANQTQTINAQMFAIEGSYDRDWARFRASFFWSSGDRNASNTHATGFDSILDAPNFAGGGFSYWNRQQIPLFGVNLVQRLSLVPNLRSSKFQGQSNFVNPGLILPNLGADFDLTPKVKMFNNINFLWFESTNALETFLFQGRIARHIGTDLSTGFEYRPLLSENVAITMGASTLIPGQGFRDIYNNQNSRVGALFGGFLAINLLF